MHIEAFNELEEIEPLNRSHPAVLLMRSRIYLAAHKPDFAHAILTTFTSSLPDSADGWFYLACAHAKRREVEKAEQALKKCFLAAAKTDDEKLWSDRAICTKDLDALWCSNQMSL
jgi:predicted Zn-dependent protease